jgi:hypothetical protein
MPAPLPWARREPLATKANRRLTAWPIPVPVHPPRAIRPVIARNGKARSRSQAAQGAMARETGRGSPPPPRRIPDQQPHERGVTRSPLWQSLKSDPSRQSQLYFSASGWACLDGLGLWLLAGGSGCGSLRSSSRSAGEGRGAAAAGGAAGSSASGPRSTWRIPGTWVPSWSPSASRQVPWALMASLLKQWMRQDQLGFRRRDGQGLRCGWPAGGRPGVGKGPAPEERQSSRACAAPVPCPWRHRRSSTPHCRGWPGPWSPHG